MRIFSMECFTNYKSHTHSTIISTALAEVHKSSAGSLLLLGHRAPSAVNSSASAIARRVLRFIMFYGFVKPPSQSQTFRKEALATLAQ